MTIKRMLSKNNNLPYCYASDRTSWYIDDSMEFHSLEEIKDYFRENVDYFRENVDYSRIRYGEAVYYKFKIIDTEDEIEVVCSMAFDDEFDYIKVEGKF